MIETIAIIPARGGSKGVPHKNLAKVAGKPLVTWCIETALATPQISRVVVSTDDQAIADSARRAGADVPFARPPGLATDNATSIDTLIHAVEWLSDNENVRPELILLMQPTAPLVTTSDIEQIVGLIYEKNADAAVSVCPAHQHPYWIKRMEQDGKISDFITVTDRKSQRQELPEAYALNGALYLIRRDVLLKKCTLFPTKTYGYIMPPERSIDIDTPWDLYLADLVLQDRQKR